MACTGQMDNAGCGANSQKWLVLTRGHCDTSETEVICPMPSIGLFNDNQKSLLAPMASSQVWDYKYHPNRAKTGVDRRS